MTQPSYDIQFPYYKSLSDTIYNLKDIRIKADDKLVHIIYNTTVRHK